MREVRVTNIVPGVWSLWLEDYARVSRLNRCPIEARSLYIKLLHGACAVVAIYNDR